MLKALLMEFIGTFFLMFVFAASGNAIAVALVLMLMIYVGANISGGQYNPAVTFGLFVAGKLSSDKVVGYIITQFLAGLSAIAVFGLLGGKDLVVRPAEGATLMQAALAEILFTFTLVLTVFMTMIDRKHIENSYFGLAVGLNVLVGAFSVGTISGGVFNPVLGIAPQIYRLFTGSNVMPEVIALYIVAPMFGGLLAAIVYGILGTKEKHTHEHKEVEEEKHHHHKSVDELNLDTLVASES